MTIRLRLTALFTALLAVVGLVWSIGMVGGLWLTVTRISETGVRDKVHEVRDYLRHLEAERRRAGRPLSLSSVDALPSAFADDGMYLQLTAPDGRPLNRSPNLVAQALPLPTTPGLSRIELPLPRQGGSSHALMAAEPLTLGEGRQIGWIQAAYPLHTDEQTIARFALVAAGAWIGFVLLAFGVGYFFAGRALAPVATMTEEVRRMRATDLHRRLPVAQPPQDEIDRLGATFNELFESLDSAFAATKRFVADASHELKTPLTAILGNLRLIRVRGAAHPESIPRWAEAAEREAGRLARLVDCLLVLARAGEGKLILEHEPVDLSAIAREVASEFEVVAPRVHPPADGEPVWVSGDRDRLKQVAINLVDNAVRATREGGEVRLLTERRGDRAYLVVADTGHGMAPEVLPHIFDRFYRLEPARDRAHGGSGLGLPITKAIVEGHHGRIRVESTPGRGTRFEVELSLAEL